MRATVRGVPLVLALFLGMSAVSVAAGAQDDVYAGYQLFHRGDIEGARRELNALLAANPGRLVVRFGLLRILDHQTDNNPALEPEFEKQIDVFIADAEARYQRSEKDEEALFYLANAYLLRAAYRVDHDKGTWGAARDGARSKRYIDTYIKRHPEHGDAYLALGTYNYYVEIAPAFIKFIRPLLFLPAGDRAGGLKQLERAYTEGSLFSYEAGMLLMDIYGTYEGRASDGIRVGEQLASRYPENPDVQFALADLYLAPGSEDYGKAVAQYEKVIASESRHAGARRAVSRAVRLASAMADQWRLEDAIGAVTATIDANPSNPDGRCPRRASPRESRALAAIRPPPRMFDACSPSRSGARGTRRPTGCSSGWRRGARAAMRRSSRRSFAATVSRPRNGGTKRRPRTSRCVATIRTIRRFAIVWPRSSSHAATPPAHRPPLRRSRTIAPRPHRSALSRCSSSRALKTSPASASRPGRRISGSWTTTNTKMPPGPRGSALSLPIDGGDSAEHLAPRASRLAPRTSHLAPRAPKCRGHSAIAERGSNTVVPRRRCKVCSVRRLAAFVVFGSRSGYASCCSAGRLFFRKDTRA
jgi:tetratricopeptide (TPR) repeat protein